MNNSGIWDHIHAPFEHAEWHGWAFTDLSFAKRIARGHRRAGLLLILVLGWFLNLFPSLGMGLTLVGTVSQRFV